MKSRRERLVRVATVIGIALGAGHVAQQGNPGTVRISSAVQGAAPVDIVQLAASAEPAIARLDPAPGVADALILPQPISAPAIAGPALLATPDRGERVAARDCTPHLAIAARPDAMIDLLLMAPCRADERVVLRHAGLAVTYRTNAAGALFASIPALMAGADVSILFAGGETAVAMPDLPEAGMPQRFGVQWLGAQMLSVGTAEDVGLPDVAPIRLGDATVDAPMLAEIYTYPADGRDVPVTIRAGVTAESCGREILGETLHVARGTVQVADLSVTMPGCDATGDYLVLKNLVPDLKLATAD
jgi:hypothetical protein